MMPTTRLTIARFSFALLSFGLLASGCKQEAPDTGKTAAAVARAEVAPADVGPSDVVYAASNVVRVVDFAAGRVVGEVELKRAITQIRFDGRGTAYVAASNGLFAVDAERHALLRQLTEHPVRNVDVADDGKSIDVLWHDVAVRENGAREVLPFSLSTLDAGTGEVTRTEPIGQRIYWAARAPAEGGQGLVVAEDGRIRLLSGSLELTDEGTAVDPHAGISTADQPLRVRNEAVRHGTKAYLPVEGYPSRVLEVNLVNGQVTALALDRAYSLRGVGVTPDGKQLVVNVGVGLVVFDLDKREIAHRIDAPDPTAGVAISSDGAYVYTAQTVDGTGGAVHAFSLAGAKHAKKIHLEDISPWALAVRPR